MVSKAESRTFNILIVGLVVGMFLFLKSTDVDSTDSVIKLNAQVTLLEKEMDTQQNRTVNLACRTLRGEVERATMIYGNDNDKAKLKTHEYVSECGSPVSPK